MKIHEYREVTKEMLRLLDDLCACVNEYERKAWAIRAMRIHADFIAADCPRATERDKELHSLAAHKYSVVVAHSRSVALIPTAVPSSSTHSSRAAKYNRSPARSVRLARAARSAMRRGYF